MIRRATDEDLLTLLDLEREASSTGLAHVFGPDLPFPVDDVLARWRIVLDNPDTTTLLDEDETGPVGYAAYGDGWLHHFGVRPRLWGTGRADTLHSAVLAGLVGAGRLHVVPLGAGRQPPRPVLLRPPGVGADRRARARGLRALPR